MHASIVCCHALSSSKHHTLLGFVNIVYCMQAWITAKHAGWLHPSILLALCRHALMLCNLLEEDILLQMI